MGKTISVVVFVMSTIAAGWGLFLVTSRDSHRFSQAGNFVLWLTIGASVVACIGGGLVFYFFLRHEKDESSHPVLASSGPTSQSARLPSESTPRQSFDITRWEQLNPWLIEGQADDRMIMIGSASDSNGSSSSVRRSSARRTHQMMYKKWSQARHE